jgi:DNA mismatch repair protein MutS
MVEMVETAQILNNATAQSLVLMDEVGRGTSTYDGLALAYACILELCGRIGALTLFATHYFELTSLAHLPSVSNMHVNAQEVDGQLVLLHQVRSGPASKSFGLQVAKLAGIPLHVIAAAHGKLTELELHSQAAQPVTGDLFAQLQTAPPVLSEASVHAQYAPLMALLDDVEVDNITPRQALDILARLQANRPKG